MRLVRATDHAASVDQYLSTIARPSLLSNLKTSDLIRDALEVGVLTVQSTET